MPNPLQFSAMLVLTKANIDAATSYTTVGTLPSVGIIQAIIFNNNSSADLYISMDNGTTDHFLVPAGVSKSINAREIDRTFDPSVGIKYKNVDSATVSANHRFTVEFLR